MARDVRSGRKRKGRVEEVLEAAEVGLGSERRMVSSYLIAFRSGDVRDVVAVVRDLRLSERVCEALVWLAPPLLSELLVRERA